MIMGSSIIIYRGPLIEHAKEQTILNKANYHKVYLVLIQCNKMCLWDKMIDFIRSTKLAVSAILLTTKFPSSKYCFLSSSFHCLTKLPFKLAKDLLFRKDFWVCVCIFFWWRKWPYFCRPIHPLSSLAALHFLNISNHRRKKDKDVLADRNLLSNLQHYISLLKNSLKKSGNQEKFNKEQRKEITGWSELIWKTC